MNDWSSRDWKWVVGILIGINLLVVCMLIYKIANVSEYLSALSNGISIVLSIVAIYMSIAQNNSSQVTNQKSTDVLARIDEKVNGLGERLNRIDNSIKPVENSKKQSANLGITRTNGFVISDRYWKMGELDKLLRENNNLELINWSIFEPEKISDFPVEFRAFLTLIFKGNISDQEITDFLEETFNNMNVNSTFSFYNSKL